MKKAARINECTNTEISSTNKKQKKNSIKCKLLLDDYNGQSEFIEFELVVMVWGADEIRSASGRMKSW